MEKNETLPLIEETYRQLVKTRKTGVLIVSNKVVTVKVYFRLGSIVSVTSVGINRFLGSMLVKASILSPSRLKKALQTQQKTMRRLGDILLESGAISREILDRFLACQSWDILLYTFLMKEFDTEFEKRSVPANAARNGFDVDVSELVRAGRLLRSIGDGIHTGAFGDQAVYALTQKKRQILSDYGDRLSKTEKNVISWIDGSKSVQEISFGSFVGEWRVKAALYSLVNQKLVREVRSIWHVGSKEQLANLGSAPFQLQFEILPLIMVNLLLVAIIHSMFYFADISPMRIIQVIGVRAEGQKTIQTHLADYQKQKIRFGLQVHYLVAGDYPQRLSTLNSDRYQVLKHIDMRYPWSQPYFYQRKDTGYLLLSPNQ